MFYTRRHVVTSQKKIFSWSPPREPWNLSAQILVKRKWDLTSPLRASEDSAFTAVIMRWLWGVLLRSKTSKEKRKMSFGKENWDTIIYRSDSCYVKCLYFWTRETTGFSDRRLFRFSPVSPINSSVIFDAVWDTTDTRCRKTLCKYSYFNPG
jgi:hypothetical protein